MKNYSFQIIAILLATVLNFSSCTTSPEDVLCGGNYKYWRILKGRRIYNKEYPDSIEIIPYLGDKGEYFAYPYIYYFDKNGTFKVFYCFEDVFYEDYIDDVLPPDGYDKWHIGNDSILFCGGEEKYKLVKMNTDSIILKELHDTSGKRYSNDIWIAVDEERTIPSQCRRILNNPKPFKRQLIK